MTLCIESCAGGTGGTGGVTLEQMVLVTEASAFPLGLILCEEDWL